MRVLHAVKKSEGAIWEAGQAGIKRGLCAEINVAILAPRVKVGSA